MKRQINKMWTCEDCTFIFQLHSIRPNLKKKPFCPNCGDNVGVYAYQTVKHKKGEKVIRSTWTPEEIEVARSCIDGKIAAHQVAIKLGRSTSSVKSFVGRLKKRDDLPL